MSKITSGRIADSLSWLKNRLLQIIIIAEVIILVCGAVFYGKDRADLHYAQDDLLIARKDVPEQQGFYVDTAYDGTEHRISTPAFRLDKGIYNAHVSYHVENEDQFKDYSRIVEVPDGEHVSFPLSDRLEEKYSILCDKIPLRNYQPEISYRFHVKAMDSPLALICYLDDSSVGQKEEQVAEESDTPGEKWIIVNSVDIDYQRTASVLRFLISWLALFAAINTAIILIGRRNAVLPFLMRHGWIIASLCGILFLAEIPMLMSYIPKGGDLFYHMLRLGGLAQGLADGTFPVKIQPIWNNGYGDAVGVMYGDLLLLIPALLYNAGFTLDAVYKFYILLINIGTIAACWWCGSHLFRNRTVNVLATAFYVLSPFRLCDLYARAAVGEHTAMMFLPIIVLGVYLIYHSENGEKEKGIKNYAWIILALGYFGIVTSHALSIIMVTAYLGLFAVIEFRKTFSKAVFPELLKAAVLAALLSVYFLIPFIDYYIHVPMKVTASVQGIYSQNAASIPQIFGLPLEREPYQASPVYGMVMLVAAYLVFRKKSSNRRASGTVLFMSVFSVWLASSFFPYALVNRLIPTLYRKGLESMQFPWRWLTITSILCFILMGWVLDDIRELLKSRKKVIVVWALIGCMISGLSYLYTDILCRESEQYDYMNVCVTNAWGWAYEIQREYAFQNLDTEAVYSTEIECSDSVSLEQVTRRDLDYVLNAENLSNQEEEMIFPIFNYKGYQAELSDGTQLPIEIGPYHKIKLIIPANTRWEGLHVYFKEPAVWRVAECVSLITAILLSAYLIISLRRKKREHAV